MEIKAPRIMMVEPTDVLPGIYVARIVATLDDCNKLSSTDARGSYPLVKSSLVIPPRSEKVAGGDRKFEKVAGGDRKIPQMQYVVGDDRKTGAGECQPELPDSSLPELDASPGRVTSYEKNRDLRRIDSFHPVENSFGNQVDTKQNYKTCTAGLNSARGPGLEITREKQDTEKLVQGEYKNQKGTKRDHVIGFVPIQVVNLSLEEIEMPKSTCVGIASPTENYAVTDLRIQDVYAVQGRTKEKINEEVLTNTYKRN
jgi:hypothetical protein